MSVIRNVTVPDGRSPMCHSNRIALSIPGGLGNRQSHNRTGGAIGDDDRPENDAPNHLSAHREGADRRSARLSAPLNDPPIDPAKSPAYPAQASRQ